MLFPPRLSKNAQNLKNQHNVVLDGDQKATVLPTVAAKKAIFTGLKLKRLSAMLGKRSIARPEGQENTFTGRPRLIQLLIACPYQEL